MISSTTIKMAEHAPGQIWCEVEEHWVDPDKWMKEYDCCQDCYELRDKDGR